ncbi:PIG-L family deacetylase [Bowmanella sp. Y26]|uniref:PIG-L deacetylase family protein n=1 Tax=Bowmanella yangjiangensis TaxID=2811230 RepID=UPI001BDC68F7|nr:PIG-L deacetylase family protein [Bowmanella yangjiangensis]MBT1062892.1 PIG-L family deacetylase [Bowmanella yangjiangensis]
MSCVLIVAPHADDETLGCGGSILRYIAEGHSVHWLLITHPTESAGFCLQQIQNREQEIEKVSALYGFHGVHQLRLPPAQLDIQPKEQLIKKIASVINTVKPEQVFTAYRNDAHSDHCEVYDAVMAATKTFRSPFIKRVLSYETMSETDFGLKPEDGGFRPNVFVNIAPYLEQKLDILEVYQSELGDFPFPRSRKALESLSYVRGAQCNAMAAEAFMLIKEVV